MKVKFMVSYGFAGAKREDVLEIDDDLTDEDINEMCKEWAWNTVDLNWERQR